MPNNGLFRLNRSPIRLEDRLTPAADLLGESFALTPPSGRPSDLIAAEFRIRNAGDTAVPEFVVALYATPNDGGGFELDEELTRFTLPGLAPGETSAPFSGAQVVPLDTLPGEYLVGIDIDPENKLEEFETENNALMGLGIDSALFTVLANAPGDSAPSERIAVIGTDTGSPGVIRLVDPDTGALIREIQPFEPEFTGGIRTASGDVNGDGLADAIAANGPGRSPEVRTFSGADGLAERTITPFEPTFLGGLFATVSDFDGDGFDDIVITPDEGGGPRVQVRSGKDNSFLADFFGIDDVNFRGGARAAAGDVNGDGTPDLVVAAGFGGGPRVAVYDGKSLRPNVTPQKLFNDFFVFEQTLRNGVYVAAGDLNGDGLAEVIAGGGPGGGPRVFALDGNDLLLEKYTQAANFFGGDPETRQGIRVAVKDADGDPFPDLIVGPGTGRTVTAYAGKTILPNGQPSVLGSFDLLDDTLNGVFVG